MLSVIVKTEAVCMPLKWVLTPTCTFSGQFWWQPEQGTFQMASLLVESRTDGNAQIPSVSTTFPANTMLSLKYLVDNGWNANSSKVHLHSCPLSTIFKAWIKSKHPLRYMNLNCVVRTFLYRLMDFPILNQWVFSRSRKRNVDYKSARQNSKTCQIIERQTTV